MWEQNENSPLCIRAPCLQGKGIKRRRAFASSAGRAGVRQAVVLHSSRALLFMGNIPGCNRGLCSSLLFERCRSLHNSSAWPPTSSVALLPGQLYACVWHIHSAQMELRSHMSSHASSKAFVGCDATCWNQISLFAVFSLWSRSTVLILRGSTVAQQFFSPDVRQQGCLDLRCMS